MKILKFGGSSVKDAANISKVLDILIKRNDPITVVFSAMGGATDTLIQLCKKAAEKDESYKQLFKKLKNRHLEVAQKILNKTNFKRVRAELDSTHVNLKKLLSGIYILGEVSPRTLDYIVSFGERTSSYIISNALTQRKKKSDYLDARKIIVTDSNYGNATVLKKESQRKIRAYYKKHKNTQIVTGFIASDLQGRTTTLGRGGSDYTAAILGEALNAKAIEIWTDVDGILSADPRKVESAFTIPQVSYQEAMELSHFGAKVIYPPTIKPALDKKIPVYIKNTFNPNFPGTVIKDKSWSHDRPVIGISAVSDVALLSLEGPGLFGVPGIAARLFGALAMQKINIILITQCSSEHSISFAVSPDDANDATSLINTTFQYEINKGLVLPLRAEKDLSIVAVIGENMKSTPGIAAKLFQSMGINGVNIVAIAQGSSELNISIVIKQKEQLKALNTLHEAFFSDDTKDIHLFIVGVGLIGGTLIEQIHTQQQYLSDNHGINLNICGIANSRKMVFSDNLLTSEEWMSKLSSTRKKMDISKFVDAMISQNKRNTIFVDNTSSKDVVAEYHRVLDSSISISTPNKLAASSDLSEYKKLKQISSKRGVQYGFETNVGAGLPIISTIRDLLQSGDKILRIEAVLSGSLSYIFNNFSSSRQFSEVVLEAQKLGFTEPDPREDLNGYDVRRKILILGREAGFDLEEDAIKLDFFLSDKARNAKTVEKFLELLTDNDKEHNDYICGLEKQAKKPRMLAVFADGKAKVGVEEVEESSPFYNLEGSDNMIVLTTDRYSERPLVIKGPGAGAEVTAAGVLAEIIRIANSI